MTDAPVLHPDEVPLTVEDARRLVRAQFPQWADLPLRPGGHGTDNRILRLGDELALRFPRKAGAVPALLTEATWLPVLAARLPVTVPEPVALGEPDDAYPFPWGIHRWVDGEVVDPDDLADPATLGSDLAGFVRALHAVDTGGRRREPPLQHYRGGLLADRTESFGTDLAACSGLPIGVDLATLQGIWEAATATAQPETRHVWMHTDLRPANLVVRDGRLAGVIDFGGLSIGDPTCEHAAVWDLPEETRRAYRDALALDDDVWLRATAWAAAIALSGIPYYWDTFPAFVAESVRRLRRITGQGA